MDNTVMVSVLIATYNHEKYIAKALESVLDQETDFPYEVIVHDDASTDRTAEIIKEYENRYPDIIKVKIVSDFTGSSRMPMIIIDCPSVIKNRKMFSARGGQESSDFQFSDPKRCMLWMMI